MKIAKKHSHLNGEEWLIVHEQECYDEILAVIDEISAEGCRTKISREKGRKGDALYSPVALNSEFETRPEELMWALRYCQPRQCSSRCLLVSPITKVSSITF